MAYTKLSVDDYVLSNYVPVTETGCWLWLGAWTKQKYGVTNSGRRYTGMAHRVFYKHFKGDVPPGMEICHKCDTQACVNPDHLVAGTHQQNMDEAVSRRRMVSGEKHSKFKVTDEMHEAIMSYKGIESTRKVAARFGISNSVVCNIFNGKRKKTR